MGVIIFLFLTDFVAVISAIGLLFKMGGWWPSLVAILLIIHAMLTGSIYILALEGVAENKKKKGGPSDERIHD